MIRSVWQRVLSKFAPNQRHYRSAQLKRPANLFLHAPSNAEVLEQRVLLYAASGNAWPAKDLITISFMPDGTDLGGGKTSNLQSTFNTKFKTAATWQNQVLKAAQYWAQQTNINFTVVPDNGAAAGSGSYQQGDPGFGDIRIGGYNFGTSVLAQAYLPPPVNNYSVAGDIQLNTGAIFNVGAQYDLFTVMLHEIGHATGLNHSTTTTATMFSTYNGIDSALNADDISGIKAIYSAGAVRANDAQEPNNSTSAAKVVTIDATTKTAVVNNMDLTTSTDLDFFKFKIPAGSSLTLNATVVTQGLSLMNPKIDILDSAGKVLKSAVAAATDYDGTTLTATYTGTTTTMAAGKVFYAKVYSANSLAAFKTGKYALILNMGTGANPDYAKPTTTLANGSPLTSGGGQAFQLNAADILVNTITADAQQTSTNGHHNVAIDKHGNYAVTWASNLQDGSGWGIFARRYNAAGVAQGSEFRVNTTTVGDQTDPAISMDHNGNFGIVWTSANQDGSGLGVYAQLYDSNGVAQGSEFLVNTTSAGDQSNANIAEDNAGNFVVTWTSANQDGGGLGVYAQRYNSNGVAQGSEFRVNTTTAGDQSDASVAMDKNGNFVIGWTSAGQDGSGNGIYAQRYNSNGVAQGSEFRVNTTTANDQQSPVVGVDQHGNFGFAWASYGQDAASSWGIYGQRYTAAGVALGTQILINTATAGDQTNPSADIDSNGNILVTWTSNGQDGSGKGVYGQIINATDGTKLDGEIRLNITTAGDQQAASVALSKLGHVVVVWTGNDAISTGVFAARLEVTKDGFDVANDANSNPGQSGDFYAVIAKANASASAARSTETPILSGHTSDAKPRWLETIHRRDVAEHFANSRPISPARSNARVSAEQSASIDQLFGSDAWLNGRHYRGVNGRA